MTDNHKSIIKLFFALIAGYIAIWVSVTTLADMNIFGASGIWEITFLFSTLILLFCYPLLSISFLFYKQVGNKFSRFGIILSLFVILVLILAMFYEFQTKIILRDHGIIIYLFTLTPISGVLSIFVIGFATINNKQKKMTQIFGYSTLICFVIVCIYSFIFIALAYFLDVEKGYNPFGLGFGLITGLVGLSALFAVLSAVFRGLKEDEQSV